jgi:hypothetical protein
MVEAAEIENQRNRSNGIAGDAGAARHLCNATREFEIAYFARSDLFLSLKD